MKKKKIVKISVITLAVLLLLGGCGVGMPFWRGMRIKNGKFPDPDRVVISMVENGEVVERELSRRERRALVKLFDDMRSVEKAGFRVGYDSSKFFEQYERYGAIKFLYNTDHNYLKSDHEYCDCGGDLGVGKPKMHTYNMIYLIVTDGIICAYDVYNGTIRTFISGYVSEEIDRNKLLREYFSKKEGQ